MGIRRAVLYVLTLIVLAGSISTQASQVPQLTMDKNKIEAKVYKSFKMSTLVLNGRKIIFAYSRAESDAAVVRMSGGVRFTVDDAQFTADEVDVDTSSANISLRGNVSMKIR
jgi:lipopolysaccharide assembly outer membrane protein LptD (OstA)